MKFYLQWYARLPSTNTFLKERLAVESQLPSGTVVAAREQTQGRGRREREWVSSVGANLTFSVLLRGSCKPRQLPSASMAAAVAIAELLEAEGLKPSLKWPNDVLVNGKKICGILSEGIPGGVIIGIGLNVNMQDADHIDQPATSVLIETGKRRDVDELLGKLFKHLSVRLDEWAQGGFSKVRKNWESKIPNIGKPVTVRDGTAVRTGILAGFGSDGELLLRDETGVISSVWAGDVTV
ncbi:MAG: biotin--[acetyl-CoA-carboxylase] ligase [Kiritimatiellales bacterium]|jgi:BirA family biotin operon repressor/biotin-[acetyl-CoA-carboxylase] ligase